MSVHQLGWTASFAVPAIDACTAAVGHIGTAWFVGPGRSNRLPAVAAGSAAAAAVGGVVGLAPATAVADVAVGCVVSQARDLAVAAVAGSAEAVGAEGEGQILGTGSGARAAPDGHLTTAHAVSDLDTSRSKTFGTYGAAGSAC